jgi:hypothetical protein
MAPSRRCNDNLFNLEHSLPSCYPCWLAAVQYAERDLGSFTGSFTASVTAHEVVALRITPEDSTQAALDWRPWHQQPIYAAHAEDAAGVAAMAQALASQAARMSRQAQRGSGGRKMDPDAQHAMFPRSA